MTPDPEHAKTKIATDIFHKFLSIEAKNNPSVFVGCNLSSVEFDSLSIPNNLDFSDTVWDGNDLYRFKISSCNFTGASLQKVELEETELYRLNLTNADFSEARLDGAKLYDCILDNTKFTKAHLEKVYFGCGRKITFKGTNFQGSILRKANLRGRSYQSSDSNSILYFSKANFKTGDSIIYMNGVDLTDAQIFDCDFSYCEMNGARLVNLKLDGMDLKNAKLRGCNLASVDFTGACLQGVDFSGSILSSAIFTGTDLSQVKLDGVDLRHAKLE